MSKQNDNQNQAAPQREPVDVNVVREALECGDPIDSGVERDLLALCDEVEQLRTTVARSRNALAELDRFQPTYLPGVRARQLVDAALAAVGGKSDPYVFVEAGEDTVHIGDGVTNASFTVSEAYTVMQQLADGLPNGRRVLGPESVDAACAELAAPEPVEEAGTPACRWGWDGCQITAEPGGESVVLHYDVPFAVGQWRQIVHAFSHYGVNVFGYAADDATVTVTAHEDGVMADDGEWSEILRGPDTYDTVADYVTAMARWVLREDAPLVCAAPGCEVAVPEDKPWCCDACRNLDLASVGGVR